MTIEKLKREDLRKYKELIDEAFDADTNFSRYNRYDEKSTSYEIVVAKEEDKIIGAITMYKLELFTFDFQPTIEIFNFAVAKDYRKRGIARKLMDYAITYAKENGYNTIHLTCLEDLSSFYEKIGFVRNSSAKYSLYLGEQK